MMFIEEKKIRGGGGVIISHITMQIDLRQPCETNSKKCTNYDEVILSCEIHTF